MSDNSFDGFVMQRVHFVVYNPPGPDLQWLAVCLGPDDRIMGVQTFDIAEGAMARTNSCADRFASEFEEAEV